MLLRYFLYQYKKITIKHMYDSKLLSRCKNGVKLLGRVIGYIIKGRIRFRFQIGFRNN